VLLSQSIVFQRKKHLLRYQKWMRKKSNMKKNKEGTLRLQTKGIPNPCALAGYFLSRPVREPFIHDSIASVKAKAKTQPKAKAKKNQQ